MQYEAIEEADAANNCHLQIVLKRVKMLLLKAFSL